MHSDAAYEALADSVVKGAASLGTASGPDFDELVMRHVDQMRRLAAVYEGMAAPGEIGAPSRSFSAAAR